MLCCREGPPRPKRRKKAAAPSPHGAEHTELERAVGETVLADLAVLAASTGPRISDDDLRSV